MATMNERTMTITVVPKANIIVASAISQNPSVDGSCL